MSVATIQYAVAVRNLRLDQTWDQANTGYLRLYDGTKPTDADTAIGAQVKQAELRYGATAFAAASAGSKTANAITQDSDAAGSASACTWWRAFKSDGTTVIGQGDVSATGGGGSVILPTTTINQHDVVQVSSQVINEAA